MDESRIKELLNKYISIPCPNCRGSGDMLKRSHGMLVHTKCDGCNGTGNIKRKLGPHLKNYIRKSRRDLHHYRNQRY